MTTIAYRDGVMAADSQCTQDGTRACEVAKIARIHGWLVGCSGSSGLAHEFQEWFRAECRERLKRTPASLAVQGQDAKLSVLLVHPDGTIFGVDGLGHPYPIKGPFIADGTGFKVALGAMEMGASAAEAVKVASKYDIYTGGPVRTLKMSSRARRG